MSLPVCPEPVEFSVSTDTNGRVALRMGPFVAAALADLLDRWNEDLIAQGVNRDSGWAEVAQAVLAVLDKEGTLSVYPKEAENED